MIPGRIVFALLLGVAAMALPAQAADKVLHTYLSTSETGLDPAVASDIATLSLLENLFDPLLRYNYLARPLALEGNTAAALPEVDASGLRYTFHIRPGIYFTPDPAFGGKPRELTAADYVYSLKRLYDPALRSPWLALFDGKIAGDAGLKAAFSYDTPIPGLQAPARYTLQITLTAPDPNFLFYLATPASAVLAREVVDAYPGQVGNHPVGTGSFRIGSWKRSDKIVLLANRGAPTPPLIDQVEVRIAEEFQGRVLGFLRGEFDYLEQVPEAMTAMVIAGGKLKPELAARGLVLTRFPVLQTYYMWMNMDDALLGGYSKPKAALRRAIALSYNSEEDIGLLKKGFALRAESPLPPNVLGYDPAYRSPVRYNPAMARALLDRYGYRQRDADGFRRLPDGKPLTLTMHSEATVGGRLRDELWRKNLNAIGLRVVFRSDKKTEIIKASRLGKVQMFESNWIADFPDGDNFYQLLYGPNSGRANYARFNLPAYNVRYAQARALPDSPARTQLYREMNDLLHAYNPWVPLTHPVSADIRQPWLKHYTRHPVALTTWRYIDLDLELRERSVRASR
ncbi:ABC transporter substrate-binding protein [Massilia sp. CF038]|uniref:ABC transporter substrate-binding protein n=1 Tax=Massilia sp. CF038 TaxID=1881045 RepID=UPI00091928C6|nr:ABC transporter substrate-binding protein [Massilia sp. CF038]SHH47156.1 ABC-type transport system, substrate-binding protein [Massilia sp. CF038]